MASGIGRNVLTYSRHYRLPASYLLSDNCTASKIEELYSSLFRQRRQQTQER